MKTKSKAAVKQARTRYSPEFKQQALARAARPAGGMAEGVLHRTPYW